MGIHIIISERDPPTLNLHLIPLPDLEPHLEPHPEPHQTQIPVLIPRLGISIIMVIILILITILIIIISERDPPTQNLHLIPLPHLEPHPMLKERPILGITTTDMVIPIIMVIMDILITTMENKMDLKGFVKM